MIATHPADEKNLDGYGLPPLMWERVMESLEKTRSAEPGDGMGTYWVATTRPDGRAHVMPVGIVWDDGKFYLVSGAGTQKSKNLARDPHCVVTVSAPGTDIVVEGETRIIRDEDELRRIATLFTDWGPQVRDGAFWHEYSAPSAGPPPWDVHEITPKTVYAVATAEPHGATRWRL
ncbi:MAG TPA: pyridoxamine 5'-phosphate oxidase family protein [Candidatus Limnocylindria bacterium]|nr:pyridoxamine 5'-phosphate oxidase family protein [Candidatus Limnocylindria bacterium]